MATKNANDPQVTPVPTPPPPAAPVRDRPPATAALLREPVPLDSFDAVERALGRRSGLADRVDTPSVVAAEAFHIERLLRAAFGPEHPLRVRFAAAFFWDSGTNHFGPAEMVGALRAFYDDLPTEQRRAALRGWADPDPAIRIADGAAMARRPCVPRGHPKPLRAYFGPDELRVGRWLSLHAGPYVPEGHGHGARSGGVEVWPDRGDEPVAVLVREGTTLENALASLDAARALLAARWSELIAGDVTAAAD